MMDHDTNDPTYSNQAGALESVRKACAVMKRPDLFRSYADSIDRLHESQDRQRKKRLDADIATHRQLIATMKDSKPEALIKAAEKSLQKSATVAQQAADVIIHIQAIAMGMTELDLREFDSVTSWMQWRRDMLIRERDALRERTSESDRNDDH